MSAKNTNKEIGLDLSTLEETERLGGKFYDNGVERGLFDIAKQFNVSSVRLRLWNEPFTNGEPYGAGGCDLESLIRTARRVVQNGMNFMLDFHYSDFWADPSRQMVPKAWVGKSVAQLEEAIYSFTSMVFKRLKSENLYPKYVQIGNEVTNGMLWQQGRVTYKGSANAEGLSVLAGMLKAGVCASRESGNVKIVLHLESSCDNARWRTWFDSITASRVDFDVIGASYYPHWHGSIDALGYNLADMHARYGKRTMVVETSYPFTSHHYSNKPNINLVINEEVLKAKNLLASHPFSVQGQADFVRDMVQLVQGLEGCDGLYYWEPAWLAVEGSTWSTEVARKYINEEHKQGGNEWANQCLFDYNGNLLPAFSQLAKLND